MRPIIREVAPGADVSYRLSRSLRRCPRPLEVIAAEPARDVDDLADEIEPRHRPRFHRLLRQGVGVDAAERYLRFGVTERARRLDTPGLQGLNDRRDVGVRRCGQ